MKILIVLIDDTDRKAMRKNGVTQIILARNGQYADILLSWVQHVSDQDERRVWRKLVYLNNQKNEHNTVVMVGGVFMLLSDKHAVTTTVLLPESGVFR